MGQVFLWYLIVTFIGLVAFPAAYYFLPGLPDCGYALSRILGLLVWGTIFWLLGSLGITLNNVGGSLIALLLMAAISGWALKQSGWQPFRSWLRQQRGMIAVVEVLFLASFLAWAFVRSASPDIVGTEKPMELAFINAILRSPTLPPNDPWLSGYAISYYYFGYVLVAMIARLAGTPGSVAFNLGVSLIFALSASGSYSILYNLINLKPTPSSGKYNPISPAKSRFYALLSPFFVLLVSNLGGFLHILRLAGVFWRRDENGEWVSDVWGWLEMGRYASPPPTEAFPHWWWWQASRIVQDFDFNWTNKGDIINEFPFFSYLLADLHPHVLAMPFAFLAVSLALNLFAGGAVGSVRWFAFWFKINLPGFLLAALVLGSLAFFNTWDFPFYVALFAGAYILRTLFLEAAVESVPEKPAFWKSLLEFVRLGFALGVSGVLFYLPFYFTFQSQAGGPLPNLIYITRGIYLWLHFAPLLLPLLFFVVFLWNQGRSWSRLKGGIKTTLALAGLLLGVTLLLTLLIANLSLFERINPEAAVASDTFLRSMAAPGWLPLILEGFKRRITVPGTLITIGAVLSFTIALLWPGDKKETRKELKALTSLDPAQVFTLLLVLIGALLVLAPEFVFLRDLFGYRINTIFKFYFQVWLMWGVAAAYAVIYLWPRLKGWVKNIFQLSLLLLLIFSLTYPLMGLWSRTDGFKPPQGFTLDGTAYLQRNNPDEYAAMQWLQDAPLGVVAEAVGGSYTQYARMASNSGQPTVLGWDFHELQWRGGTEESGSRRADIERLYCTSRWEEAEEIIRFYQVRYIVVGEMEYLGYGVGSTACAQGMSEAKFIRNLPLAFQQGNTSIYLVPEAVNEP
jgi:YYY domain-containing protein